MKEPVLFFLEFQLIAYCSILLTFSLCVISLAVLFQISYCVSVYVFKCLIFNLVNVSVG